MRQERFQGQFYQGQEQMVSEKNVELVEHEVQQFIQNIYQKMIIAIKKDEVSLKNIKSLKETDICVDFQQKQKLRTQKKQQENFNDYIEQKDDSKIGQNIFIGSNPGLFYSKHSIFDQVSFNLKNQQKLVSIGNLLSILPSEKNMYNHINENSLQISGDTILDISTYKDVIDNEVPHQFSTKENEDQKKQNQKQIVKQQSTYCIPQNRLSKHSKYCDMILITPVKKQKDFVVPILRNQNRHNKSHINKQQYFHLNDKNLTKFFVPQEKRQYVETFRNESKLRIKDNESSFSKSPLKQNIEDTDKIFRRSNMKKFVNTCRNSTASNPNFKSNHFESHQQNQSGKFNTTNTKFLIKVLPSEKTKNLFNQSVSTFINHNYRPITCRKQFRKNAESETANKQITISQIKTQNCQIQDRHKLKQNLSCDDIALKNSFKKMSQNSIKSKKINLSEIQKQPKSIFMRQKSFKPLIIFNKQNEQQIVLPKSIQKTFTDSKFNQAAKSQTMKEEKQTKQSMSRITTSTKNHQNKYKNFTQMQIEMIKNNNIKRFQEFKKTANSKLNIVTKMGVKISPD